MRVLLTNDDGFGADGLMALWHELQSHAKGIAVAVCAPERERSAIGHAITLHKPLHANPVEDTGMAGPAWSVSGTPADSTKIAVLALMEKRPDLVISGINRGANVGIDVLYSGTVSAALEAQVMGIPAIAVSLQGERNLDYRAAATFTADLVARLPEAPLPGRPYLLNVNIPARAPAGVAITRLGLRCYDDKVVRRRDPRGRTYYWLAGDRRDPARAEEGTDIWALARGLVSITPLRFALTDDELAPALEAWAAELRC